MTKKILSIGLAAAITMSMATVAIASASAATATEHFTNDEGLDTYRYYFIMPQSWYNDNASAAGIYWWGGSGAPSEWAGYVAEKDATVNNLYYCDVPTDVGTIIWNNTFDGGSDSDDSAYLDAIQTINIPSEYYEEGDSDVYPDGVFDADGNAKENFDGMIYVIDETKIVYSTDPINEGKMTCGGEWFFYYGDGKYGVEPTLELAVENGGYYNTEYCTPGVTAKVKDDVTETTTEATTATEATTETTATEATTEATTATEATTDTVAVPALTVNATSNYFDSAEASYNAETKEITVTYYYGASKDVENTEWWLNYDPSVLTPTATSAKKVCPTINGGVANGILKEGTGYIKYVFAATDDIDKIANFTNNAENIFCTATFKVNDDVAEGTNTTINLDVKNLTVAESAPLPDDPDTTRIVVSSEALLVNNSVVQDNDKTAAVTVNKRTELTASTFVPTEPTTVPATEATTETEATTVPATEATTEAEATTAPATEATTTVAPSTTVVAPTEVVETTEAPAIDATTVTAPTAAADVKSSTGATSTTAKSSTSDTAKTNSSSTVQTGEASMALIILTVLLAATGVMFVLRKKEMF